MNFKKLERSLRESMESAIEEGWAPRPVFEITGTGTCCLMGSFLVDEAEYRDDLFMMTFTSDHKAIAKKLGIPQKYTRAIWMGFDARSDTGPLTEEERRVYDIALRIRRDYYEFDS